MRRSGWTADGGIGWAINFAHICAEYLGKALALFIDILNPEVIILGSIYGRVKSLLEPGMKEVIRRECLTESYQACRIVPAGLSESIGDMAALSLARGAVVDRSVEKDHNFWYI